MVKLMKDSREWEKHLGGELVCFGSGRNFQRFVREYKEADIAYIIDNYASGQSIVLDGNREVDVISLQRFLELYRPGLAMVITTRFYLEVIGQLNAEPVLADMVCYVYDWLGKDRCEIERDLLALETQIQRSQLSLGRGRKFQIWNNMEGGYNAGAKAPRDVNAILTGLGYENIIIHEIPDSIPPEDLKWQTRRNETDWQQCCDTLQDGDILFLQHSLIQSRSRTASHVLQLRKEKEIKIITFIHDVEKLRLVCNTPRMQEEYEALLEYTDVFIVHNEKMKRYFIEQGLAERQIVCLELFDYLSDEGVPKRNFNPEVIIAGNFEESKSGFVRRLDRLPQVKFHLFGANYDTEERENVTYHGAFSPEQLKALLPNGFGLIWDGPELETCSGNTGTYLRYNNPHKLSLYLASGLPVIVWDEAAAKDFVEKNGLGLAIGSLLELPEKLEGITRGQYEKYCHNAVKIAGEICAGQYTKKAMAKAELLLAEK